MQVNITLFFGKQTGGFYHSRVLIGLILYIIYKKKKEKYHHKSKYKDDFV